MNSLKVIIVTFLWETLAHCGDCVMRDGSKMTWKCFLLLCVIDHIQTSSLLDIKPRAYIFPTRIMVWAFFPVVGLTVQNISHTN